MTATLARARVRPSAIPRPWAESLLLVVGLGAITVARAAATRAGVDPLLVGAAFGIALVVLAHAGGVTVRLDRGLAARALLGVAVGLGLVLATIVGGALGGDARVPGLGRAAAPFVPWAAITVVVAVGEEALLRGALFDRLRGLGGPGAALLVTAAAFALMHVPLYGWHVIPLDLAVGLGLGGLRIATRGIAAPAAAHVVADLATWWL